MKLRQFEHVVAIADHRNFHRAAEAVGVTQSALTQSIRNLEEEQGVALFKRSKRDISPTAFGVAVIQCARQTLAQVANLRRELDLMKNLQSGRLIIGCDAWLSEGLLGPVLTRILGRYPELRLSVRVGSVEDLSAAMLAGSVDLYVGAPPEARDQRISWHELTLPPLLMVCNPNHPLLELERPGIIDCLAYPIAAALMPRWFRAWLSEQLGEPRTADGRDIYSSFIESDEIGVIRQLVRSTDMVTGMLPAMVAEDVERGLVKAVHLHDMMFPIPAVVGYPAARPLAPAGEVLLEEILIEASSAQKE